MGARNPLDDRCGRGLGRQLPPVPRAEKARWGWIKRPRRKVRQVKRGGTGRAGGGSFRWEWATGGGLAERLGGAERAGGGLAWRRGGPGGPAQLLPPHGHLIYRAEQGGGGEGAGALLLYSTVFAEEQGGETLGIEAEFLGQKLLVGGGELVV